jgi:hypothetical protein
MKNSALVGLVLMMSASSVFAGQPELASSLAKMKIKEVTVFKDGHAFILHSGNMPVNADGKVVMDYLPSPVLGTYWPYSADKNAKLRSVVAGKQKVQVEKTALTIREMIEANVGAQVVITDNRGVPYEASIVGVPTRSGAELEALNPATTDEYLAYKADVVLLKTVQGIKPVEFNQIRDLVFVSERKATVSDEEFRNRLTMDLEWKGKPRAEAELGMVYLQRGIRWIPSYKIAMNDDGNAVLKLEATIINELTDLSDVTTHLVVGVPSFAFKDSVDPISLRQDVAHLASSLNLKSRSSFAFSNAIMSQVAMPSVDPSAGGGSLDLGPEITGSKKSEDLYLFTIEHITLSKGERMVLPIAEYEVAYEDVYALDIPFSPPLDVFQNLNHSERRDIMTLQAGPKVMHKIRIANQSDHPFTTAPAMIMKEGRILAQGMMTYTPIGGKVDIELTTAVDISVKKTDNETERTPSAVKWNGNSYFRVDLDGNITLTNYKTESVTVEITRSVLGNLDTVGSNGTTEKINPFEDRSFLPDERTAAWWYSYSWPWWWHHFNAVGRITWTTTLEPNESADHTYSWHYFWR